MSLLFGKYTFHAVLDREAILPPFKGSTFRGIFGRALKDVICALKQKECADCLLSNNCLYPLIFESHIHKQPGKRKPSPPHPFVIEPPLTTETHFPVESPFEFTLLLFGNINESLPYFIYAFERMGEIGIGRRINGIRGKYQLKSVESDGRIIYSNENKSLNLSDGIYRLEIPEIFPVNGKKVVDILFETPFRTKLENRLNKNPELHFDILLRSALRRIETLFGYFSQNTPAYDYDELMKLAKTIQIKNNSLFWTDWKRYSFRQKDAMYMGGFTGSVSYEGELAPFIPILRFCEKVHIGKQTTFGLGKFKIYENES